MSVQTAPTKIVNGKNVKVYSLVLITDEKRDKILLGLKKRGFGVNLFNGFGGKLAENETIEQCAEREVFEECSLVVRNLEKIGILVYEFIDSNILMEVHFFHTSDYTGEMQESDEMKPIWFDIDQVPFHQMWSDDFYWYPYFLKLDHFCGYFKMLKNGEIVYQYLARVDKNKEIEPIYEGV